VRVLLNNQNTKSLDMVLADLTSTVKHNAAMCILMPRSGTRPWKAVRVLLNNRNTKSLDMVLAGITSTVKRNAAMCILMPRRGRGLGKQCACC
jgi:hypothetical protein